jgi:hypothetical protein
LAKGAITLPEGEKARAYLRLHESPWPNEPAIDDHTEIYLDDLSITYLQAAGVLERLKLAGLNSFISENEDREATALLTIGSLGDKQLEYLEKLRSTLADGIKSGSVRLGATTHRKDADEVGLHPNYTAISLAAMADAIVLDDRGINHFPNMNEDGRVVPVLSSLDVLDLLRASGDLSVSELVDRRTELRRAGYQLIPVTEEELLYHMRNADVSSGLVVETAELKSIREALKRARMASMVQLPAETPFLHGSLAACLDAIKAIWRQYSDRTDVEARADYLLGMADIRKWAASAAKGFELGIVQTAYASYMLKLTSPPLNASSALRKAFLEWITNRVLEPIKAYQPEVYRWLVARYRELAVMQAEAMARESAAKS